MATSEVIQELKDLLEKNLQHTHVQFNKIRAGKATPNMLDGVVVPYYDVPTPLSQMANINTPDARTITIQAWDKSALRDIETAIVNSNLGFAPQNDGEFIRINVPPLTEERRREFVKKSKAEAENSKIGIRNLRKEANEQIRALVKDGLSEDEAKTAEAEVQIQIDLYIKKTDEVTVKKEAEIMTV